MINSQSIRQLIQIIRQVILVHLIRIVVLVQLAIKAVVPYTVLAYIINKIWLSNNMWFWDTYSLGKKIGEFLPVDVI